MRNILAIAKREVVAYFASTMGWLVLCAFLLVTGFFFAAIASSYAMQVSQAGASPYAESFNLSEYLVAPFFGNMSVILLMLCPALSMRLFAEDRRTRSMELLLTSPVSTFEIVVGKYLGGMGFVGALLLATVHYPAILYWLGNPDTGVILCTYLALLLQLGAFMAIGLLASAFTENQVVAAVLSFAVLLLFWVLSWADSASAGGTLGTVLSYASMMSHMEEMSKGLIHLKDIVYYVSFIAVALFATQQRVEAYRWR
jgi:ABC-2 type transport system permease protein